MMRLQQLFLKTLLLLEVTWTAAAGALLKVVAVNTGIIMQLQVLNFYLILMLLMLAQLEYLEKTKMTKPMIRIHNLNTDEVIDREMNAAEYKQYEADQAALLEKEAEAETKALAKSALLVKLGITEDEANLLLG